MMSQKDSVSSSSKHKNASSNSNQNISDEALLKLSVKDLNRLLKSLSPDDRNKLKKRRRILKNRG